MNECLEHKGYLGSVEVDAEANVLHGEVIGIRDVVTFEGASVDELRRAFQESVDDYLDYCKQRGETPDKPWSGRFVVRISSDLHRSLSLAAVQSGVSLNALVADLLARGVEPSPSKQRNARPKQKARKQGRAKADVHLGRPPASARR